MKADLDRYAALHVQAYGEAVDAAILIPHTAERSLLGIAHLEQLPGIRWKLHDLAQLQKTDAEKVSPSRPAARNASAWLVDDRVGEGAGSGDLRQFPESPSLLSICSPGGQYSLFANSEHRYGPRTPGTARLVEGVRASGAEVHLRRARAGAFDERRRGAREREAGRHRRAGDRSRPGRSGACPAGSARVRDTRGPPCLPAILGPSKRGVPTAHGTEPLVGVLHGGGGDIPVWQHPEGSVRGPSLSPIYRTAPDAALADPKLHRLRALLDALRIGRARERELAAKRLQDALGALDAAA